MAQALSRSAKRTYEVEFSSNDELLIQGFFAAVDPQLKIIQLNQLSCAEAMEVKLNLDVTYEEILQNCHTLQQVNLLFTVTSWDMLWAITPAFPKTVEILVIRILRGQLTRGHVYMLFDAYFLGLKAGNPDLKTIQFYSEMNIRVLQRHPMIFRSGLLNMKMIGISILDNKGNIMEPDYS